MKKQLKKVVGLLFASSVLIACGQQNPGTAAFVGDTRITSDHCFQLGRRLLNHPCKRLIDQK